MEEDVNGFTLSLLLKFMSRAQEFMGRDVKTCLFMLAGSYAPALGVGEFTEIWALDHPFKVFQTKCKGLPNPSVFITCNDFIFYIDMNTLKYFIYNSSCNEHGRYGTVIGLKKEGYHNNLNEQRIPCSHWNKHGG